MIRKRVSKVIDTIYNKTFEDEAKEFIEPSKTDQSYFVECDIYCMLERGQIAARPLMFGEQSYDTLDDICRIKREYQSMFDSLSPEQQRNFGSLHKYIEWVSNPANYVPVVLPELSEITEVEKDKVIE